MLVFAKSPKYFIFLFIMDFNYSDKLFEFWLKNCREGEWTIDQPLPQPEWISPKEPFVLNSIEEYENLNKIFESELQILLKTNNYDSVSNLIRYILCFYVFPFYMYSAFIINFTGFIISIKIKMGSH